MQMDSKILDHKGILKDKQTLHASALVHQFPPLHSVYLP